jgi:hypothetical protein
MSAFRREQTNRSSYAESPSKPFMYQRISYRPLNYDQNFAIRSKSTTRRGRETLMLWPTNITCTESALHVSKITQQQHNISALCNQRNREKSFTSYARKSLLFLFCYLTTSCMGLVIEL